jgi:hypothetical protein
MDELLSRMDALVQPMRASGDERQHFLSTYMRTTVAVKHEIERGTFVDGDWTERWDIAFADLYLEVLEEWNANRPVPGPWRIAFEAANATPRVPPIRHLLLGMNAHINYDLPQSLLGVITDEQFTDARLLDLRRRDHERIDAVLASRVGAEDAQLAEAKAPSVVDRLLTPLNRAGTKRFLKEARAKVWHNTLELQRARLAGAEEYRARLAELEVLSAAKIADLLAPGQVVLRLSVAGFGVVLPPPA